MRVWLVEATICPDSWYPIYDRNGSGMLVCFTTRQFAREYCKANGFIGKYYRIVSYWNDING